MMVGDWVAVVGWGQQVATGQQESPPPGTYAIKQQGESFISEMAAFEFKVGEEVDDVRKSTVILVVLAFGKATTECVWWVSPVMPMT